MLASVKSTRQLEDNRRRLEGNRWQLEGTPWRRSMSALSVLGSTGPQRTTACLSIVSVSPVGFVLTGTSRRGQIGGPSTRVRLGSGAVPRVWHNGTGLRRDPADGFDEAAAVPARGSGSARGFGCVRSFGEAHGLCSQSRNEHRTNLLAPVQCLWTSDLGNGSVWTTGHWYTRPVRIHPKKNWKRAKPGVQVFAGMQPCTVHRALHAHCMNKLSPSFLRTRRTLNKGKGGYE